MGPERDMPPPAGEHRDGAYPAYPGSGQARAPRPPLTKRIRRKHWIIIDCVMAAFGALCDAAILSSGGRGDHAGLALILLVMAVVFLTLGLRRLAPAIAFATLLALGVLLFGHSPSVPVVAFLADAFALYTVTVTGRRRTGIAALTLILAVMVTLAVTGIGDQAREMTASAFVPVALANVIAWMTGFSVRQRRLYAVTMQHQAASSAVAEERLRIARELHDVVAHSMSVIAVQAGYGQYVIDASPDGAKHALGAIQASSRDALEEMRRMLGVLRQQDGAATAGQSPPGPPGHDGPAASGHAASGPAASGQEQPGSAPGPFQPGPSVAGRPAPAPLSPAPGLASLERLVARTGGAGVRVRLEVLGDPRAVAAGVDLSAYRIIQEALTNVVKHAGTAAACTVSVCYTDTDLIIRVTDDGGRAAGPAGPGVAGFAAGGTGHGLIGMRERVALCAGTFSAGPLPGGGFQVTATLPLPTAGTLAASEAAIANGVPGPAVPAATGTAGPAVLAVATGGGLPAVAGGGGAERDGQR